MQNRFPTLNNPRFWTASERVIGHMLRAPDDHPGAPPGFTSDGGDQQQTPAGGGNNETVIPTPGGGTQTREDNTGGNGFDAASFWKDEPSGDGSPSPSDSAVPQSGGSSAPRGDDSRDDIGTQLMAQIDSATFGDLFTKDIAEKINEGDFTAANEALTANLRDTMKTSLRHNATLLREFGKIVIGQVDRMIEDRIGKQVNSDYLVEHIPAASNPKVGPAIRDIYERALTRSNGDRTKAVEQTKAMMRTLATEMAGELDLTVAPHDPHSDRSSATPTNWLEELAARG